MSKYLPIWLALLARYWQLAACRVIRQQLIIHVTINPLVREKADAASGTRRSRDTEILLTFGRVTELKIPRGKVILIIALYILHISDILSAQDYSLVTGCWRCMIVKATVTSKAAGSIPSTRSVYEYLSGYDRKKK